MSTRSTLSASDVLQEIGISHRQLDYWCTRGIASAPTRGSGDPRRFDAEDVARLRFCAEAAELGIPLAVIRRALDTPSDMGRLLMRLDDLVTHARNYMGGMDRG